MGLLLLLSAATYQREEDWGIHIPWTKMDTLPDHGDQQLGTFDQKLTEYGDKHSTAQTTQRGTYITAPIDTPKGGVSVTAHEQGSNAVYSLAPLGLLAVREAGRGSTTSIDTPKDGVSVTTHGQGKQEAAIISLTPLGLRATREAGRGDTTSRHPANSTTHGDLR